MPRALSTLWNVKALFTSLHKAVFRALFVFVLCEVEIMTSKTSKGSCTKHQRVLQLAVTGRIVEPDCCLLPLSSKHKQQCDLGPVLSSPPPVYTHIVLGGWQYRTRYSHCCLPPESFNSLQRTSFGSAQGFSGWK